MGHVEDSSNPSLVRRRIGCDRDRRGDALCGQRLNWVRRESPVGWSRISRSLWCDGLIIPEVSASKISAGNGATRLIFGNDGVGIRVKSKDGTLPWPYFSTTLERGDMYLLKLGNRQRSYIFIPKRAFGSQSDERGFRQLVNEHTAAQLSGRNS